MTRGFPSLNIYLSLGTDFYFSNLIFIKHKSRHSSDILVIPVIHCCYRPWRNKWESYLALCRHLVVSWTPSASWDQFLTGRWHPWVCCSVSLTPQPLWGFKISLIFYWWLNEASVWPGTFYVIKYSLHVFSMFGNFDCLLTFFSLGLCAVWFFFLGCSFLSLTLHLATPSSSCLLTVGIFLSSPFGSRLTLSISPF